MSIPVQNADHSEKRCSTDNDDAKCEKPLRNVNFEVIVRVVGVFVSSHYCLMGFGGTAVIFVSRPVKPLSRVTNW